ncbi:unnamed protein product [Eruca vesicaria subsp. sativa]|uniref:Uncharacterized protein n=1 Tax=Eruca vesicaria subsp. sativa TaxID=29727 RepID=A0ABC8J1M7_ERUVS|nr:unnamed protein product [Eruca vesicaria subsp. sativa]
MSERGKMKSEPMKVVFINTQYVETDGGNRIGEDTKRPYEGGGGVGTTTEFDRFFKEMPHMEELYKLWSDN